MDDVIVKDMWYRAHFKSREERETLFALLSKDNVNRIIINRCDTDYYIFGGTEDFIEKLRSQWPDVQRHAECDDGMNPYFTEKDHERHRATQELLMCYEDTRNSDGAQ
jgi:hypothetical protein